MAHTATGSTTSDYFYAYLDVSTSAPSNSSSCTVTVSAGAHCTGSSVSTAGNFRITFTAAGQTTQYNPSSTGTTYYDIPVGSDRGMGSKTFTYTRGTSSSTKAIGVSVYFSYGGTTSTASTSVTIPALASWTVSYDANNGSGAPASQTKYYGKNLTLSSTKPTRSGYTFMGWGSSSTDTTVDYASGGTYSNNEAIKLYAIWKKDITLSYDANNGSGAPSSQSTTVYNATTSHQFTISSTRPTRTNYDFLGWSLSNTATTASYQPSGSITLSSSDTLYAVWKLAYIASTISNISAVRCNSDGTDNDDGDYGKLTFKVGKYSNGSSQSYPTVSAVYDTNTSITLTYTEANNIRTYTSNYFSLSGDNQHDIVITKADGSYGTKTFSTYISAKFFTIDITADGKGIGLLTTAPSAGIALGDHLTTDLTLYTSSGDSPGIIFQRGTLTDDSNDWRIYDKGGYLYFGHRGSGSTDWPTAQEWSINTSGVYSGTIAWSHVNSKPFADSVVTSGISISSHIYTPKHIVTYRRDTNSSDASVDAIQYADDGTTEQAHISLNAAKSNNHGVWSVTRDKWLIAYLENGTVYLDGKLLADRVVAQGSTGGTNDWQYRKWSSGKVECWLYYTMGSGTFSPTGNVYYRGGSAKTLPFTFKVRPWVYTDVWMGSYGGTTITSLSTTSITVGVWAASSDSRNPGIFLYIWGEEA